MKRKRATSSATTARRPSFRNLPENAAREVLRHLDRRNTAGLRMASRATREMGRAGGSCNSQRSNWPSPRLNINGVAVGLNGTQYPWTAHINPRVSASLAGPNQRIEVELVAYVDLGPHNLGAVATLYTDRIAWRWFGQVPGPVKDQITGCFAREVGRHAAYLVQIYTAATQAVVMETGPTTVAHVHAAIRRVVEE